MDDTTGHEPFSNHRWFLANSRLNVHFIAGFAEALTEAAFQDISRRVLAAAPDLLQYESLETQSLRPATADPDALARFERVTGAAPDVADLRREMGRPFADTGEPTFWSRCIVADAPNAEGFRSLISFETSHAISEGGDLVACLRDRRPDAFPQPPMARPLSLRQRFAVALIAPATAVLHLSMSKLDRRARHPFGDGELALDRGTLRAAARRIGVSQKALLFALVLFGLRRPARRHRPYWVAFAYLPKEKAPGADDDRLAVRLLETFLRITGSFPAFARDIEARLAEVNQESPVKMALADRTHAINRFIWRRVPALYRRGFFGYAPYDFLLSMLPPVRPTRGMALFRRARLYAGSGPAASRACIFLPGPAAITLNIHAEAPTLARLGDLAALAEAEGIDVLARGTPTV